MRVAAASALRTETNVRAPERATREVEAKKTPLTPGEIRGALSLAYQKLHDEAPPPKLLDVLSAQVSTETASGASMHNYNFGGIKGTSPQGLTARAWTHEVYGGKEVRLKDGFRAYRTPVEGAIDSLSFLEKRFPRAIDAAKTGDVGGYVARLKAGRYFTADETQYANAMRGHMNAMAGVAAERPEMPLDPGSIDAERLQEGFIAPPPGESFATTLAVTRVLDAMSSSSIAIARPTPDEP